MAAKPLVEGLRKELGDDAVFLQIDIRTEIGSELAHQYGLWATPSFIVFDRSGEIAYRDIGGFPDKDAILLAVRSFKGPEGP